MTWTGQTFSVGQILTATQMNNLQGDITAHANGDTGAPQQQTAGIADSAITTAKINDLAVTTAKIADASVTSAKLAGGVIAQSGLKTTTGEVSTNTANKLLTLPGGTYGFYPQIRVSGSTSYYAIASIGGGVAGGCATYCQLGSAFGTSYLTRIYLASQNSAQTVYARHRYVQASPPYDLGDGEIPLFVFAIIDNNTGDIETVYSAPEAPWHYNGPTDIRTQFYNGGKRYRIRKDMSKIPFTWEQAKGDPAKEAEYMAAFAAAPEIEEEITQAIKNADMSIIPHPFTGNDISGKTVVMLDPISDLSWELATMCGCHDDFSLNDLLHSNYFKIDNRPLNRKTPAGVTVVPYRWRNTA